MVIARFLDDLIPIPGTKQAIGAEAIASFVPGFGSAAGAVMSGVVIADSIRLRLPLPVIARMLFNLGIDALLGYIPWVGPVFDAWFRANRRNMRLLERALVDEQRTSRSSVIYLITSITMSVVVIVGLLTAAAFTIYFLLRWFGLFG